MTPNKKEKTKLLLRKLGARYDRIRELKLELSEIYSEIDDIEDEIVSFLGEDDTSEEDGVK